MEELAGRMSVALESYTMGRTEAALFYFIAQQTTAAMLWPASGERDDMTCRGEAQPTRLPANRPSRPRREHNERFAVGVPRASGCPRHPLHPRDVAPRWVCLVSMKLASPG